MNVIITMILHLIDITLILIYSKMIQQLSFIFPYAGTGKRQMYDRITVILEFQFVNTSIFPESDDGLSLEIQVFLSLVHHLCRFYFPYNT